MICLGFTSFAVSYVVTFGTGAIFAFGVTAWALIKRKR